jgi:nicotinate-nucleotide adenylyltransferase
MTRLCFGGSFNPIHHGHLIVARAVAEARGYDQVILIPSAQPPHKPGAADLAPAADRLAMCRLAAEMSPDLFEVNDLELRRQGPSYTIDTARELTRQGLGAVHWLIGGDTLPLLSSWHEPEGLLREVQFVVAARPGWQTDWSAVPAAYLPLRQNVVTAPLIEISATDIRRRAAAGKSIDFLTPPAVVRYIRERGVYGAGRSEG